MKLHTSLTLFESLHRLAQPEGKGKKAANVSVTRQDLLALLMDHSNMVAKLKECGVYVEK